MDLGLTAVCRGSAKDSVQTTLTIFGALHSHGLTHDGASTSKHLKVGYCSSTRRGMTGCSRERAKGGGGRFVEKRAHRTRLTK